jgi:hypothetical protein
MSEDETNVVRRSDPEGYLTRIINGDDPEDNSLKDWAAEELVNIKTHPPQDTEDSIYTGVPEKAEKRYGLMRPPVDFSFDNSQIFADRTGDAYRDAKWKPGFTGVKISGEVNRLSGGAVSDSYEFIAGFGEQVGLNETVYKTQYTFEFQHDHEDGRFDKQGFIDEQLTDIAELLKNKTEIPADLIEVVGSSIVISKQDKE